MSTRPHSSVFSGVVRPRHRQQLLDAGVTPAQLRGPGRQRTSQGFYLPAGVDLDRTAQRIMSASVRAPSAGAVAGWAAAHALGADQCDGLARDGRTALAVPLCTGGQEIRTVSGVEVWADPLSPGKVVVVDGVPVTIPARTCFDGMRRAEDIVEAVVFADLMLHAELVDFEQMRTYVAAHPGWRGGPQARRALGLADRAARNGWESRLRMVWVLDARLPRPLCNRPVFDLDGNLLGIPDLLDPDAATVGEYDGKDHRLPYRHHRDNVREELFEDHGLVVTRATSLDYRHRPALADRMRRAHARGMRRDRRQDRWTLEPPPDWGAMGPASDLRALLDEVDATWVAPW